MNRRHVNPVAHCLGLKTAPLLTTRSLPGQQISATHIVCGPEHIGMTARVPREDTFQVAINLTDMPIHEVWSKGRPLISEGWAEDSMRIVNLAGDIAGRIFYPHEVIGLDIPRASLDSFTDEAGGRRAANLSCPPGTKDLTVTHLVRALLPAFARPQEASALFVDHTILAVCSHLVQRHGGGIFQSAAITRGGLTPAQTARAKDLLANNLKADLCIADIAKECGVSRQHFIKAFKKTVGCTPHQWLQRQRVNLVKDLLGNTPMPISEIALKAGFADQSHLTRVFGAFVGDTPAVWRRQYSKFNF